MEVNTVEYGKYMVRDSTYTPKDCKVPVMEVSSNVKCLDGIVKKELGFGPDSDQEACCI